MDVLTSIGIRFLALLGLVPNVVWSGIVASVITVLGVLVTNFGLSRRHREQLKATELENTRKRQHDASESALDRTMRLRRDIYIPAIEAVTAAGGALGGMVDPAVPSAQYQTKFADAIGFIHKVNAVSSEGTVVAAGNLLNALMTANVELLFKRAEIDAIYGQLQANAQTVDRVVSDHGKWVETQTSLLFDGPPTEAKWNFVAQQIAFKQSQMTEWVANRDTSSRSLRIAQLDFLRSLIALQPKISEPSIALTIALRSELDMSNGSQEQLRKTLETQTDMAKKALEDVICRLEVSLNVLH